MLAHLYRFLTDLGAPGIRLYLLKRRLDGREDRARFRERLGDASVERPASGRVIWCHAASVGEAASLLSLIDRLRTLYPHIFIVLTTGTVTSARMLEKRLPPGVVHQYVPVDRAPYVQRFLRYWRPDLALWVESELWPNTLAALRDDDIPAVLLNGRMSAKSFRSWSRAKGWARDILSAFRLCLVQTEEARARYAALGADPVRCISNLKYASNPLPCDMAALAALQADMVGRPLWGMISTHRGEEDIALTAHRSLRAAMPRLLTVLVPRHPARGDEIARRLTEAAIPYARRSRGEKIGPTTEIYLADTIGELGLFYRLCPVAVMGGSFVPVGGHNPIEPAQLGCAILFGPSMYNFSSIAREFVAQKAAMQLRNASELVPALEKLLADGSTRFPYARAAQTLVERKRHVLDEVLGELKPWLRPDDAPRVAGL